MSVNNAFREIAIENAAKQSVLIDSLLEESPILAGMPMEASTHGLSNVFEKITATTGAGMVDFDAPLGSMDATTELAQNDLSIIGGEMFVGEDKARKFGSATSYFDKKLPIALKQTGMDIEASILYNNLRAFTIENSKAVSAGGSSDTNYSIVAVTWTRGEVTGLYDAEGFGNGKVFDIQPINGGNLYKNSDGILGYGIRAKSYMGVQLANKRYLSSVVNIDLDSATPSPITDVMMDDLLLKCRYNSSTKLYMHPRVLSYLQKYKGDKIQMSVSETDINRVVMRWNGIEIVTSYNFKDATETDVVV
jgi:hypothetical protein